MRISTSYLLGVFLGLSGALSSPLTAAPDPYQDELQQQLILAEPGDVIVMPAGSFNFDQELSIAVANVTLRGQGQGRTVLRFAEQSSGAQGIYVSANGVQLEDFSIEDTPGDGIKAVSVKGFTVRRVNVAWTGPAKSTNGGYGIYPVLAANVLIEDCTVSGASDAGIYVGQSKEVIVRRNLAHGNVAGIEIENTQKADVYGNEAFDNTAGLLVFNLPDLSQLGFQIRVFDNDLHHNNRINFAAPSNIVADVPAGTGLMLLAAQHVEVFANLLSDNDTANLLLAHYGLTGRTVRDPSFLSYVSAISIYGNMLLRAGKAPAGGSSEGSQGTVAALREMLGLPFPDVIYDGALDPRYSDRDAVPLAERVCLRGFQELTFVDLDWQHQGAGLNRDLARMHCRLDPLPAVAPW